MVSSETESDGSILSEAPRGDVSDGAMAHIDPSVADPALSSFESILGPPADVRAVGSTLASSVSTRGKVEGVTTLSN